MTPEHIISTQIEIPESTYDLLQRLLKHNPEMDINDVVSLAILKLAIYDLLQRLLKHNPEMDINDVVSLAILKLAISTLPKNWV